MKTLLRLTIIFALMIVGTTTIYAQNEYRRTIEKSCPVIVKAIDIDHSYGSVVINEWDKDEIYMSAEIVTKGKTNEIAKEISNCIDVKFVPNFDKDTKNKAAIDHDKVNKDSNGDELPSVTMNMSRSLAATFLQTPQILFDKGTKIKTEINHNQIQKLSKQSTQYQINITINAPRSLATMLICKYGTATLNAPIKDLTADTKYGNLSVGQVDGNAKIVAKYGNVIVDQVINLNLEIKYGKAKINNVDKLNATVGFGSIDIEKVIDAQFSEIGYSQCTIGQYVRSLDIESLRYGSLRATGGDSFTSAIVDAAYSPVTLNFSGNVTFNSDLTNSYGSVSYKGIGCSTSPKSGNRQIGTCGKEYNEYFGKETGKIVRVKNSYADIAIVKN